MNVFFLKQVSSGYTMKSRMETQLLSRWKSACEKVVLLFGK